MSTKIQVTSTGFRELAKGLDNAADVIARSEFKAVNAVAERALKRSKKEIVSRVNLTDKYVTQRMGLRPATKERAVAYIVARVRATRLATYGAKQAVAAAPGAKGDKLRRIRKGQKQAGVSVGVKKNGGPKLMPGAFQIPLLNGNGMGVFIRTGRGKKDIRHLYSLSVDQVFKSVLPEIMPNIAAELDEAVTNNLELEIRKALKL